MPAPQRQILKPAQLRILVFLLGAVAVLAFVASLPVWDAGDSHEYLQMLQAWANHGTPDVRPEDARQVGELLKEGSQRRDYQPLAGFFPALDGRWYCWHFWMYPLFAVPAKLLLRAANLNEIQAFFWTNFALYLVACHAAIFRCRIEESKRWMLVGLCAISPVLWYVCWMHTEAFSLAFALLAVVFTLNRRYAIGAICASLGSMQNPPLMFLAFYIALLSIQEKNWRVMVGAFCGAAASFLPTLFSLWKYQHPNLILRELGFPSAHYITLSKVGSLLFDLNQGMLPYVPLFLLLALFAFGTATVRRNWRAVGIGFTLLAMILSTASSPIWITATAGLQRYAIWMLPVFAWLIIEALPDSKALRSWVAAAVIVQAAIVLSHDGGNDSLSIKAPARVVWTYAPALDNPEFVIFGQRVSGSGDPKRSENYPISYVTSSGDATKILTNVQNLPRLKERFRHVDPQWLRRVEQQNRERSGLFYLHPPIGAVRGPL